MSGWWILAAVVVLIGAYICGRAVGIVLDINPYLTEVAAVAIVLAAVVWAAARRSS